MCQRKELQSLAGQQVHPQSVNYFVMWSSATLVSLPELSRREIKGVFAADGFQCVSVSVYACLCGLVVDTDDLSAALLPPVD